MYIAKRVDAKDAKCWSAGFYNSYGSWAIVELFATKPEAEAKAKELTEAIEWIPVKDKLPECSEIPGSFGVPVFIKQVTPRGTTLRDSVFYGRRVKNEGGFYIFGAEVTDVQAWAEQPRSDLP